jgi:hypothetical protein
MSFPFSEKIGRAQIRKARNIFSFWGCRVKRGGGGASSFVQFPFEKGSRKVYNYSTGIEPSPNLFPKEH